jgi:SAM-dependent methyltransferase
LPSAHWKILAEPPFSILETFNQVDDAIDTNADIADAILETGLQSFGLPATPDENDAGQNWHRTATNIDVGKAHSTIRQFYRDWSEEGKREREVCYDPVLAVLDQSLGNDPDRPRSGIRVLVPGAGLGRLVFDICAAGYTAEGNEISYHQLLASSWMLNHSRGIRQHALYPFALHFSNLLSRKQQLQKVMIPDAHPASAMALAQKDDGSSTFGNMGMSAADFIPLYSQETQKNTFDAVATVFFIDTSPNLIRYIETIRNCLKPGGLWINVGPLLWHFENDDRRYSQNTSSQTAKNEEHALSLQNDGIAEPGNVELTEEEVFHLVQRMGFTIEVRQPPADRPYCGYIQDPDSMLQNLYRPSIWVARKAT